MKKRIIFLSLVFLSVSSINAQTWNSVGAGMYGTVRALAVYNSSLYAGGLYDSAGGHQANDIASWNGGVWDSLEDGILPTYSPGAQKIYSLCGYNDSLFCGGNFREVNNISASSIAQWNGIGWDTVGERMRGAIYALTVFNGELYVGGNFWTWTFGFPGIAKWNGTSWDSVSTISGTVYALAVYNGELYAGGSFNLAGYKTAYNIARWNGTVWDTVGSGMNINGTVYALAAYNGSLYAGGYFDSAGRVPVKNIAQWNGSVWSPVGAGMDTSIFALGVDGSILIAGGAFTIAGGINANHIAYWNGTSWDSLGAGTNGTVYSLCDYSNELYVGGSFSKAGNINANSIARWSSLLGVNEIADKSEDVKIYPNPNNGQFTIKLTGFSGQSSVNIYNVLGEKVYSAPLKQILGDNSIDISNQPAGIYLYRVLNIDGGLVGEGKVVIQK